jgi:uncharacterized protein YjiS (DUF1127 family)
MEITMSVVSSTTLSIRRASAPFFETGIFAGRRFGLQWLFNAAARFTEYRRRQRAIAQLQALDDRHLKDMGLVRCEIAYRVNHPQER